MLPAPTRPESGGEIVIPVAGLQFYEHGHHIWIFAENGGTVLRLKSKIGFEFVDIEPDEISEMGAFSLRRW